MNSIIQQMYFVPTFRYAIMSSDDNKPPKPSNFREVDDDNLLHQLQIMYTYLTLSEKSDFAPRDFCYSYKDINGNPTNVRSQQDSQEFYNNFCDKIENALKETKFKYIVSDVFMGQTCSSVECNNCKNVSNRFEDYYNLTLEVKNINDLTDSLNKMSVPEIIDDFKCSNCNQKVRIEKKIFLNKLPNVLVVHLKRFYLNYEIFKTMKINSKFVFPKNLNLKQYCIVENQKKSDETNNDIYPHDEEYYEYELKGINVHTGSADGGHYFSFIDVNRDGKNNFINNYKKENWLIFNDSKVLEFDTETIPTECYGGNYEGSMYENCQNAYLLIYERKKKMPIRVLYKKNELGEIDKNNLININKENRSELNKKYDLSRSKNTDITEDELYKKIFFDEEKTEYYKYIPFYNIPKYAPTKVYNEIMEENNTKEENQESKNNNTNLSKEKYEEILTNLIKTSKLDINNPNYDDNMKQVLIESIMDDLIKSIQSTREYIGDDGNEEFNNTLEIIFNKLIKPVVKIETSDSLLNTICEYFCNEIFMKFIFTSKYQDSNKFLDKVTNEANTIIVKDILFELVKIFCEKEKDSMNKTIYKSIFNTIKKSSNVNNTICDNYNEKNNYKYTIIYLYQLIDDIIHFDYNIMDYISESCNIITLAAKLMNSIDEDIKNIILKIVKYLLKHSNDYPKELSGLFEKEDEKEKENIKNSDKYITYPKDDILTLIKQDEILKALVQYDFELFVIIMVIGLKDEIQLLMEFFYKSVMKELYEFLSLNENEIKIDYILKILLALSITKDKYSLERYKHILGYPNPIICEIPRKNNDDQDDKDEPSPSPSPSSPTQNFPIFGEKLINGNLDKHIYEFVNINRRKKSFCLLKLLMPKENEENNDINVPKEIAIKYIIKLIENCLGENNNYSLFKYLYLNPSRCLRYENLYQEMKQIVLNENKDFNFEQYSDKEGKFIAQIQKEVEKSIKDLQEEGNEVIDDEEETDENAPPLMNEINYDCEDEKMKKFIGFISNIIPGDIVREEIVQIATGETLAMYRLEYYTKYYDTKELREKLLNKEQNKDQIDEKQDDKINNGENRNINKEENKEEKPEEEKKEEEKPEEEKKEEEKKEEEKKEEENPEKEKKEEEKKEEENPEEEKKEEKPEEEKKEEEKKEEEKPEEEKPEEEKKEEEKKEEEKKEKEKPEEEKKEEEKKEEEKKEEEKKEEEKKEEEKRVEEKPEEEKPEEERKEEEKKEEEKKEEEKKEEEKQEEEKKEEEKKEEEKPEEEKPEEEKPEEEKQEEEKKEEKPEKEKKEENKETEKNDENEGSQENSNENDSKEESKNPEENPKSEQEEKSEEEKAEEKQQDLSPQKDIQPPLETDIDDSLEIQEQQKGKIIQKYNTSSSKSEENYIYSILPSRQSVIILENDSIKDKNKVKRVLFRYILTNTKYNPKSFKATISIKNSLTQIQKNNSCVIPEFIFDKMKGQNMSNFYNVYRIRGELPFIERDNSTINIELGEDINFNKK